MTNNHFEAVAAQTAARITTGRAKSKQKTRLCPTIVKPSLYRKITMDKQLPEFTAGYIEAQRIVRQIRDIRETLNSEYAGVI